MVACWPPPTATTEIVLLDPSAVSVTVQVEPKVLRLLLYLIENRNRLVRKQELLDRVWPDAMVTENALTRVVGLLRKALRRQAIHPMGRAGRFAITAIADASSGGGRVDCCSRASGCVSHKIPRKDRS
jgi:hypothetical protein